MTRALILVCLLAVAFAIGAKRSNRTRLVQSSLRMYVNSVRLLGCGVGTKVAKHAIACFALCVSAVSFAKKPQPDGVVWINAGTVSGATGSYTPIVPLDATTVRVYGNTDGVSTGDLFLRNCTWQSCGPATRVLHIESTRDTFIRTSGVVRGASGSYYAVLYTGDGYPTQGGYSPSWATSPDGVSWQWKGPITIFGRNQSSAAALVVDESRTDAYACMAWLDIGPALYMMHAPMPCDPAQWTSDGLNMWPIANEGPQFVTAARDQWGYHLVGANTYPATALRHAWSCDGLSWRIIETASDVINTNVGKGTNLAVQDSTLHALSSGVHWTIAAQQYSC